MRVPHVMIQVLVFPHTGVKTNLAVPLKLADFIACQLDLNTADRRTGGGDGGADNQSRAQHHLMMDVWTDWGKRLQRKPFPSSQKPSLQWAHDPPTSGDRHLVPYRKGAGGKRKCYEPLLQDVVSAALHHCCWWNVNVMRELGQPAWTMRCKPGTEEQPIHSW